MVKYYEVSITSCWLVSLLGEGGATLQTSFLWNMNHCIFSFMSLNLSAEITQRTIKYL